MNILQKRFLAFLLLCIPSRIIIALIAKSVDQKYLPYLGYLAILPAIGFAYIFIFGKRLVFVGREVEVIVSSLLSLRIKMVVLVPYFPK